MKHYFITGFIVILLGTSINSQDSTHNGKEPKNVKGEQLAKVGFLQFTNIKASKDIAYLGESISDAFAKSMQTKFYYAPIENMGIEAGIKKIIEVRKENAKKTGKTESGNVIESLPFQIAELAVIARETTADILIYGQYEPVGNNEAVNITTRIFFAGSNTVSDFNPEQHPIDGSLFRAIDVMAKSVIDKIADALSEKPAVARSPRNEQESNIVQIDTKIEEKIKLTAAKLSESTEKLSEALRKRNDIIVTFGLLSGGFFPSDPPSKSGTGSGGFLQLQYGRYLDNKGLYSLRFRIGYVSYGLYYNYISLDSFNSSIQYYGIMTGFQGKVSLSIQPFMGFMADLGFLFMPGIIKTRTMLNLFSSGSAKPSTTTLSEDSKKVFAFGASLAVGYNFVLWNWLVLRPMAGVDYLIGYNMWPWVSLSAGVKF